VRDLDSQVYPPSTITSRWIVAKATNRSSGKRKAVKDLKVKSEKVKGGTLASVSRTRSEISMTFARNARA
jgi:hypothetical protein